MSDILAERGEAAVDAVKEMTSGVGVDSALECVGTGQSLQTAMDLARPGTKDELTKIGSADELQIASVRSDGTLSKPVMIWSVAYGDSLYVRSVNDPTASWFRGTQTTSARAVSTGTSPSPSRRAM